MLNTKVTANISTMFCCYGSSGRLSIVNMLAVTFVFNTKGFPPFVLLSRLCLESYVIPLLDFRLGSYEPHQKFPTYFVQWRIQKILVGGDLKHKTSKFRMSSSELRVILWPKSEIQTFFSPKIRWSPNKKKKKKKRSSPKSRVIFRPKSEIQTFFRPKSGGLQKKKKKKKKGLHQNRE